MSKKIYVNRNSVILFRILLSFIFIVASLSHLFKLEKTVNRINQAKYKELAYIFGDPKITVIGTGIVMLIAGLGLMVGFKTKYAAIILAIVLVPITLTIQVGQMETIGTLFKNIAIFGGLIFFSMNKFNNQNKN